MRSWPRVLTDCRTVTIGEKKLVGGPDLEEIGNDIVSRKVFGDFRYASNTLTGAGRDTHGLSGRDNTEGFGLVQHAFGSVSKMKKS